jgi:hypothetical protein
MIDWKECIGYLASVLIAVSITINSSFYFRIINLTGSACFVVYGLIIGSYPVAIINAYCFGINIFHLIRNSKKK